MVMKSRSDISETNMVRLAIAVMVVVIVQLNICDVLLTYIGVEEGAVECNPLYHIFGEETALLYKFLFFNMLSTIVLVMSMSDNKLYIYMSLIIATGMLIALLCAVLNNIIIIYEMLHAPQIT